MSELHLHCCGCPLLPATCCLPACLQMDVGSVMAKYGVGRGDIQGLQVRPAVNLCA